MKIDEYITNLKKIYQLFIQYIENEEGSDDDYDNLISCLSEQNINENHLDLNSFFRLLNKVSKNHHRDSNFQHKIEKILLFFENEIKQTFTIFEIYDIFKNSKQIFLFLIKNKIAQLDDNFISFLIHKRNYKSIIFTDSTYHYYFFPEIEPFLDEKTKQEIKNKLLEQNSEIFDDFDSKRQIGENDSFICELIRNDSVVDFIQYVNQKNIPLTSQISPSIFETHPLLLKITNTTLIQYAAFYGSIQIFQYLKMNNVELSPSLWLYSIHSKNPELIHILEENHVTCFDESYEKVFIECIKCHHNDIANYIKDNLLVNNEIKESFDSSILSLCFHYHNFEFFPSEYDNNYIFYYACQYGYLTLVKLLFTNQEYNLNDKIVSIIIF